MNLHRLWASLAAVLLGGAVVKSSAQSTRPGWGATPYADAAGTGVTFRVWAPNASSVTVPGQFNSWNTSANPLALESVTSGVWSADLAGPQVGQMYKYNVNGTLWKTDPRARRLNSTDNHNAFILSSQEYSWSNDQFTPPAPRELVIYEMHLGTFAGPGGSFAAASNRLAHLQSLGVNAIELMPVNEFLTGTSWGYNPAYPFAVENNYGTPDDFKAFVRECHARGFAVLLDVVHNHWDGADLWQFDGWSPASEYGGIYFYSTQTLCCTDWGPRPDYSRPEVRGYIQDTFRMWLDEYRLDGFRWDTPAHILYAWDTNGTWQFIPEGWSLLQETVQMIAAGYTNKINIAENMKDLAGFDSYWDTDFAWRVTPELTAAQDADRQMADIAYAVDNSADAYERVLYTDSHDTAGDLNGGSRLPAMIDGGNPTSYWARKRSALGAALVFTAPGIPMILQGQEMLENQPFSDTRGVDWTKTNTHRGVVRLYRDLIALRRNLEGLSGGLQGDDCDVYHVDDVNKLIAFLRRDPAAPEEDVVVIANFANAQRTGYELAFPGAGEWYVHFNSDDTRYGGDYDGYGSARVTAAGATPTGRVDIGRYSALILSRTPRTGMLIHENLVADQPGNTNGFVDPGEMIRERIALWNKSSLPATNVSALLSSPDPAVTILESGAAWPDMGPGEVGTNPAAFRYRVGAGLPCGTDLPFRLVTTFNGISVTETFSRAVGQLHLLDVQTNIFDSPDVPKEILDNETVYSELAISSLSNCVLRGVSVSVRINHSWDGDVSLGIVHPDHTEVVLSNRRGGSRDNFGTGACGTGTSTVFDASAEALITTSRPPYAGRFRPEGDLSLLNDKPANGTWRLRMTDHYTTDQGTNLCWGLTLVYQEQAYACTTYSNRPPAAMPTGAALAANSTTNVLLSGTDGDGDPLTFAAATEPAHGLASGPETSTWLVAYRPAYGFAGTDTFTYVADDGFTSSAPAEVTLVVQPLLDTDGDGMPDDWELEHFTNETAGAAGEDPRSRS